MGVYFSSLVQFPLEMWIKNLGLVGFKMIYFSFLVQKNKIKIQFLDYILIENKDKKFWEFFFFFTGHTFF